MRLLTLGFLLIATVADPTQARAQGTSFTYQGRLIYGNEAVNGSNDLTFTLYDAATGDGMVGASNVFAGLLLSNGNFTVTLDFGAGAFGGAARWLEIATRPGAGSGAFTNLAPRQPITPTPYAMFAGAASAAGLTGTIPLAQLPGTVVTNGASGVNFNGAFTGDGGGLTNLNISSLSTNVALRSGGNTFSGDQNFASGRVGIGTATPVSLLDVRVPGSVTGGISFGSYSGVLAPKYIGLEGGTPGSVAANSGFSGVEFGPSGSGASGSGYLAFHTHQFAVSSGERMRVTADGRVGIGTQNPQSTLQLGAFESGGSSYFTIATPGANLYRAGIALRHFNGGYGWTLESDETQGTFNLVSHFNDLAGVNRMQVDRFSGNVGIGKTSPEAKLDVGGAGQMESLELRVIGGTPFIDFKSAEVDYNARIIYNPNGNSLTVAGASVFSVGGDVTCVALNITSDRNAKEQFKPVNAREVLDKVARLPITEWQYKTQNDARHIGPMAQDFREAFGVGRDEKHITSVDADGVALAAIQGLNSKLEEKSQEVEALKKSVSELRELVNRLSERAGR